MTDFDPTPLPGDAIRVYALGGISEIGRNMTVIESPGGLLVIDCGVLFPSNDMPGVDFILPDFTPILDRLDEIVGIVLTHGHEDHIGGVPYLLAHAPHLPLYGTRFTLALVAPKLAEHKLVGNLQQIQEGDAVEIGPFGIQFYAVNHSVPDGVALSIDVNGLRLFHTGDFRFDQRPLDMRLTDLAGFAEAASGGLDLLMADSTNADVPGHLLDEVDVAPNFLRIFEESDGLVLVACFASHIHRVQQVITCAAQAGKRVALMGRSMERHMQIAQKEGLLEVPPGVLIANNELEKLDRRDLVIACTGSQGEPMAVLARLARREHRVKVQDGDTVILSARLIPGNETDVFRVINSLAEQGVTVLHGGNADIHVSGHASAGELRQLHNLMNARFLMPVHGEWRHLRAHASIAHSVGIGSERIVFAPNGSVVEIRPGQASVIGHFSVDDIMVDQTAPKVINSVTVRDRRTMGFAGMLLVTARLDEKGTLLAPVTVRLRGLSRNATFIENVQILTTEVIQGRTGHSRAELEDAVTRRIRRWLRSEHRRLPAIDVLIIDHEQPTLPSNSAGISE